MKRREDVEAFLGRHPKLDYCREAMLLEFDRIANEEGLICDSQTQQVVGQYNDDFWGEYWSFDDPEPDGIPARSGFSHLSYQFDFSKR